MAIIPNDQQILTSSADVNTTYGGSDALKELNTWYTMEDITETVSANVGAPYKSWVAHIYQSGTSAPTIDHVFQNDFTFATPVQAVYIAPGVYELVFDVLVPFASSNTTTLSFTNTSTMNALPIIQLYQEFPDTNRIHLSSIPTITVGSYTAGTADNSLLNGFLEIRVYN